MSVVYASTLKTNRLNLVNDTINSKTINASTGTGSAGQLVIGTSALSGATGVLATLPLNNPAGTVSGNTFTLNASGVSVSASATGTAALAELRTNGGTTVVSGLTVGTSGTDIVISSTAVSSGQTVTLTSGSITHG